MPELQKQAQDKFNIFIPFSKVEEQPDGTIMVYGRATQEIPDRQNEIFDYESSKPYFLQRMQEYMELTKGHGVLPLSAMHNNQIAAGNVVNFDFLDAEKAVDAISHVVDPTEVKKVKEHVYNGYSLGGKYKKRERDAKNPSLFRFTGDPLELSLVNKPAVPTAVFSFFKLDETQAVEAPNPEPAVTLEPPEWMLQFNKSMSYLEEFTKAAQATKDGQEAKLKALGERVGIPRRQGSPINAPKDYPDDPSEYGDPANWNFPVDEKRHVQAVGRFNGGEGKEQYSPSARHAVGRRIARLASRFGEQYRYDRGQGQILNVKETKKMTEINKLDVGAFLDSLKSFRDQVDDKEAFDLMVGKAEQLKDPSTTIDIEHPAVSVPGATTTQLARSSPSDEPTAKKVAAPPKKSPPPSSTSTDDDTTSTTPTSSTPPPVKKADDPVAVLTEMQMKTVEALNKLAGLVGEAMKKSAFPAQQANDPLSELNAILGSHSGKMPLSEDPVIKALEGDDMYSFSRALAAAGGDDDKNKFKKANATNEVFTKLRQATIDELTARGFTASLMSDSHWRPLPPPP